MSDSIIFYSGKFPTLTPVIKNKVAYRKFLDRAFISDAFFTSAEKHKDNGYKSRKVKPKYCSDYREALQTRLHSVIIMRTKAYHSLLNRTEFLASIAYNITRVFPHVPHSQRAELLKYAKDLIEDYQEFFTPS